MYININKTLEQIKKYLADSTDLCKAYESTLRLQSQLLALIYDAEAFSAPAGQERLANSNSFGQCNNGTVTLVLEEPLPSMKRLTEAVEEHWKDHDVLYGFMPDHGCHDIDGGCGSHGLDMEEDMNIIHFYGAKPRV